VVCNALGRRIVLSPYGPAMVSAHWGPIAKRKGHVMLSPRRRAFGGCAIAIVLVATSGLTADEQTRWFDLSSANADEADSFGVAGKEKGASTEEKSPQWLTFAAYLETSYRATQFYQEGHDSVVFYWDARLEAWLPPFREEFPWGPYLRLGGTVSNRSYAWSNHWFAQPGFGLQIYPLDRPPMRQEDNVLGRVLRPMRLFAEYNRLNYWGSENTWRPDWQFRWGLDYWLERNVHDTDKWLWGEIGVHVTWLSGDTIPICPLTRCACPR